MSDKRIQNFVLFKHIQSYARKRTLSWSRHNEDEQRLLLALHNYGAIAEEEMETIDERQSEVQEIIHTSLDEAARINRDASGSHED